MRIANPQSPNRLGRFLTADYKSPERLTDYKSPERLTELITKKTAYEERNLENRISDSTIYLDRHRRLSGRDELHGVEHYKH